MEISRNVYIYYSISRDPLLSFPHSAGLGARYPIYSHKACEGTLINPYSTLINPYISPTYHLNFPQKDPFDLPIDHHSSIGFNYQQGPQR